MLFNLECYRRGRMEFLINRLLFTNIALLFSLYMPISISTDCFSQDFDGYIRDRISFDYSGLSILHRNELPYLNFVDEFPRFAAHKASAFVERYAESIAVISEADTNLAGVQDPGRLINVFFGGDSFPKTAGVNIHLSQKYKQSMIAHHMSDEIPKFVDFELLDRGCAATRHVDKSIIGSTFLVIDEELPDLEVERCLYLGVSYSFGINATHNLASPATAVERNIDFLVHSAAQQCSRTIGKSALDQCIDRTIKAALGRNF